MEADVEPVEADPVAAEARAEPSAASAGVAEATALSDREGQRLVSTQTVQHEYLTLNGKVARETITTDGVVTAVMDFIYDESGRPFALKYSTNGTSFTTYYYVLNLQGDVVGLINSSGSYVAKYTYDAWGNLLSVTNASGTAITSSTHIANRNPLRYRGYYFDSETGFYYLQSRYYDPATRRFINADAYASTDATDAISCNMFAYCLNNPVVLRDSIGLEPVETIDLDGDGEIDCYVYEYSYSGTHSVIMGTSATMPVSGSGRVYIFIDKSTEYITNPQNCPNGFNPDTDFMASYRVDKDKDNKPNYVIQIANSYKCTVEVQMRAVAKAMKAFAADYRPNWDRSEGSIVTEWREHNRYAIFADAAKHTDFDTAEEGKGAGYFLWKAIDRAFNKVKEIFK